MSWDSSDIHNGMLVLGTQGERIGKVIRCGRDTFVVEKGVLFPKDYELRYDHIAEIRDDDSIVYALADYLAREDLAKPQAAATAATDAELAATVATAAAVAAERTRLPAGKDGGEVHVQLMDEELEVEKLSRESGRVRIHKTVTIEERHFTVPVRREEITIEHLTADKGATPGGEAVFEEQTLYVPLYEEELHVTKRPTLREEVVVRTVTQTVQKQGSASLRHEDVEIEDTRIRS